VLGKQRALAFAARPLADAGAPRIGIETDFHGLGQRAGRGVAPARWGSLS
jgi:hypothetical protein